MKNFILTLLCTIATFSIVCYAGTIYDDARQAGIAQYNSGNYSAAAKHFIAIQNIAPVNNDLGSWITKCNNKMVQSRNARIKKIKSTTVPKPVQNKGSKIERYDSVGHFGSSNLALVRYNNKYGFINKDSIIIVPVQYDDVYATITETVSGSIYDDFIKANNIKWNWSWDKGQLMSVCRDGKWGYINDKGEEVIPTVFDDVRESIVFKYIHLIGVGKDEKYGFIDWNGNIIIPLVYDHVCRFYEGMCPDEFKNDLAAVVKNGKMGFIDKFGKTVLPFDYEPQYNLDYVVPVMFRPVWSNCVTDVKKDGKFGLIDVAGETVTGFKFDGPGELNVVQVGSDYKTYFEFPINERKAYYFEGKLYYSEADFNQAVTNMSVSSSGNGPNSIQIKIVDSEEQAGDSNYPKLKLMKHELEDLQSKYTIKSFNYFVDDIAVIEFEQNKGICLLYQDKEAKIIENIRVHWPHFNSGMLGCCYHYSGGNKYSDGFYLNQDGQKAFDKIKMKGGNETVIGASYGKEVCAGPYNNGYAETWHYKGTNAKYGMINMNGELVVPCDYDRVYHITNGYIAQKGDNVLFINDERGTFEKIKDARVVNVANDEFILYLRNEGYRRYTGAYNCTEKSAEVLYLSNQYNLHVDGSSGKFGYCNNSNDIVIPRQFQKAKSFSEGLACVCIDGKYGFIDTAGEFIIKPMFDDAGSFSNGIAWVRNRNFYYYIDKTGKLLNDAKYSFADDFHDGFGIVKIGNTFGIVATTGLSTFDIVK